MRRLVAIPVFLVALGFVLLMPFNAAAQLNSSSFSPVTWYGAGANYTYSVAAGDLNNDGFADIVVSNQRYNDPTDNHTGVGVYINNGDGTFHPAARYPTDGSSANPWESVAIADMDGDGKPDLVVLNSANSPFPVSVSVMRGNGDGTFQAAVSYLLNIYPNTSVGPNKLAVADVNLDGKPDVLVSDGVAYAPNAFPNNFRGGVSVLLNHGDGTLASPVLYDSGGYVAAGDVNAADVNGDGFPDILVVNVCSTLAVGGRPSEPCRNGDNSYVQGTVGVLLGNGNGTFQQAVSYASGGIAPSALVATDLNHDGKLDLLVTNGSCFQCNDNTVQVLLGIGDGSFQPPVSYLATYNFGAPQPVVWVAAADVDGDGHDDAVVLSGGSGSCGCTGTLSVLLGNGNGTLQAPTVYNWFTQPGTSFGDYPNTVVVSDVNNDGKPDVVVIGWTSIGVLLNQTPRATTTTTLFSQPNPSGFGQDVTFTATVLSSTPGTPSGTVTFTDGVTTLGSAPLVNSVATFNTSSLSLGSHSIVASYSSDSSFRASASPPLPHMVKAGTTTTLASSANPSGDLQSVTFTATVTAQFGGALTGNVTFKDGSTVLGSVALSGNTADFTTSSLAIGAHSITAVYSGDVNNLGSTSAPLNQTVSPTTQVTVNTLPPGLSIDVDGVTYTAPQMFSWISGSVHTIATVSPQTNGFRYVFMNWSDGGASSHGIVTPAVAASYIANFVVAPAPVPSQAVLWGSNAAGQLGYADDTNFKPDAVINLGPASGVMKIAAGSFHSLSLKSDGSVWAWGQNDSGQIGDGSIANQSPYPDPVSGLGSGSGVAAIAAGSAFSMALKSDGTVLTWGSNFNGQLGDGTMTTRLVPGIVNGLGPGSGVVAIAAGATSAYALKSDGTVLAWGNNANGNLGDGTTTQRLTPVQVSGLGPGSGVVAIASGVNSNHALALKSDGSVVAWGNNPGGQLGDGTTTQRTTPTPVSGLGPGSGVVAVGAGASHSVALQSSGAVLAWGSNALGQIGDGTFDFILARITPVPVSGLGAGSGVVAIAAGATFNLALKSDGTAQAWGNDSNGQLGNDNTFFSPASTPVTVDGLVGVTALAAGNSHSLALKSDGSVLSWGSNSGRQLGKDTIDANPFPLGFTAVPDITAIRGGSNHTLALKSDGTVWAWGNNETGQLGDGWYASTADGYTQVRNSTNSGPLTGITSISAGNNHSLALASDGTVWAWGANFNGQLGIGTTTSQDGRIGRLLPVQVSGFGPGSGVVAMAAGNNYSLALKSDGSVWAWGTNTNGTLGDGTTTQRTAPVQVTGLGPGTGVVAIAAGNTFSLALKADGTVWAWGSNANGLGDGTLLQRLTPVPVKDPTGTTVLTGVIAVAVKGNSSLALKSDGTVWAWGGNGRGQLGDGTLTARPLPVQVVGAGGVGVLTGAVGIAAGNGHSIALKSDGTVWAWGVNFDGRLGNGAITTHSATPVQVLLNSAVAIDAGGSHGLALVPVAPVTITLNTSHPGVQVRFDGINFIAQATNSVDLVPGTTFDIDTTSPQPGPAGTRYVFANWSDGGAIQHTVNVPNVPTTYTLNFTTQYQLTTAVSPAGGGTISANPGTTDGYYDNGVNVQLTAIPAPGYIFTGWSGDLTGTTNPQSLTMSGPRNVAANFALATSVTIATSPAGLGILVDGTAYMAPQTFQWIIGSSHMIEAATPQAGTAGVRYAFATWSDGGASAHSVTSPAAATTYTANFNTQYQLVISASPAGAGTVTPASGFYDAGQVVPVMATPAAGYQFSNWTGPVASSTSAATSVTMSGPATVTANFANASTSIVLTSSANPSVLGQPVTLTAAITPGAAAGKVTFYDGASVLGVATITNGQATLSTSLLPFGNRSLKAFYQGSGSYNSSVSPVVFQTVNTAPQHGFAAPVIYSGFQTLFAAAAADFNRDGRTDVAVTNVGTKTVDVLLGTGTGSFQPAIASVAGVTPYFAAAADFNEDGIPDLVVGGATTSPGSSVNILLGIGDGRFQNPIAYTTSGNGFPNVLVVGDFNGDGHSDVAVSLTQAFSLDVFLGKGDGLFQPAVNYSIGNTGDTPIGITAGDFNGDGNTDLAVGVTTIAGPFSYPTVVKILLGTGSGGFQAGASYTVGLEQSIIAAADLDADGRTDLVSSSYGDQSVKVMLGNGDGTFRGPFSYGAGLTPLYLAIGDFNGDGRADVAVSGNFSNTLSVLFGNGDGTLQAPVAYPIGAPYAFIIAVGEFNGDGRSDVAIPMGGVGTSGELRILLGAPPTRAITVDTVPPGLAIIVDNVNYTAPQTFQWTVGSNHTIATATPQAGLTGTRYAFGTWSDGGSISHSVTTPAAATTYTANFITQYQLITAASPSSGGTVTPPSGFYDAGQVVPVNAIAAAGYQFVNWTGPVASSSNAATAVTLSGPATVTANFLNPSTSIVLTSSANPSVLGQPTTLTATLTPSAAAGKVTFYDGVTPLGVATITNGQAALTTALLPSGDRSLKALYQGSAPLNPSSSPIVLQTVTTLTQYGFAGPISYSAGSQGLYAVAAADFNKDGRQDLAVTSNNSTLSILLGVGNGTFQPPMVSNVSGQLISAAVADLNEDGFPDLIVGRFGGGVTVLLGIGNGSFQSPITYATPGSSFSLVTADFNADGHADIAAANQIGNSFSVLLGNGDGTLQPAVNYNVAGNAIGIGAGDFNGDGKADLVVGVHSNGTLNVFLGTGTGSFQAGASYNTGVTSYHVAVADFNSDGRLDVSIANANGQAVNVLLGNGNGTFQPPVAYGVGGSAMSPAVGDFNGDRKADIVVPVGSVVKLLQGNGDGTFQSAASYNVNACCQAGQQFAVGEFNADGRSDLALAIFSPGDVRVLLGASVPIVTVDTTPSGRQIIVDNVTYTAPQFFQWSVGSSHTIATTTPQPGSAGTRFVYTGWSDGGALSHTVTAPSISTTLTANFTTQYQLTLSTVPTAGGSVSPASGAFYSAGQVVSLVATPATGYAFGRWTGPVASPTSANTTVTMNGPVNLTANFTGAVQLTVTVSITRAPYVVSGQVFQGYEVGIQIRNTGTATAQNVQLNLSAITLNGLTNLTPFTLPLFTLAPGAATGTYFAHFSSTAGPAGGTGVVRYSGTYTGGTFSGSVRVTLP